MVFRGQSDKLFGASLMWVQVPLHLLMGIFPSGLRSLTVYQDFRGSNPLMLVLYGAVTQLVRVPHCLCGCCGFKSHRFRYYGGISSGGNLSLIRMRQRFESVYRYYFAQITQLVVCSFRKREAGWVRVPLWA